MIYFYILIEFIGFIRLYSFDELSEEQKRSIYQYISSFSYNSSFETYEEMVKLYGGITLPEEEHKRCKCLTPQNIKDFRRVHNIAFLQAPNGAAIDDSELEDYPAEYRDSSLSRYILC